MEDVEKRRLYVNKGKLFLTVNKGDKDKLYIHINPDFRMPMGSK